MPAPVHEKTWQFQLDNLVTASDALTEKRTCLLGIVNHLVGFGSAPLTVIGSSDGTAHGMDATNRWSSISNLVVGAWIVLQDTGIAPKFQIALRIVTASGGVLNVEYAYSYAAGFGTANGGTDGNATTRPTATDQQVLVASSDFTASTASNQLRWYIWRSTDGQQSRIMVRNVTNATWRAHIAWGRPKNRAELWDSNYYVLFYTTGLTPPDATSTIIRTHKAGSYVSTIAGFVPTDGGNPEVNNQVDDWRSGSTLLAHEIHMGCATVGSKSQDIGTMVDCYAAPAVMLQGEAAPATGSKTWAAYKDSGTGWLLPHNNSTLKFGTAP